MTTKRQIDLTELNTAWTYATLSSTEMARNFFAYGEGAYGKQHNFGYPGEALERFVERETLLSLINIRSLATAACITSKIDYEFYQGQKENFGELLSSTNEMKQDGILQSLVAYWNHVVLGKTVETEFISLLSTNSEKLATIELLLSMPEVEKVRGWILKILSTLDTVSLIELSPYQKTEELKSLALIYEFLRPKKSECKDCLSIYDISMKAWRLSKKELKFESAVLSTSDDIKEFEIALGCTSLDLLTIHYGLLTWERNWAKIAEIAKDRVFEAWLKAGLTNNAPITTDFKSKLESSFYSSKEISGKASQWIHEILCEENLIFIQSLSENFSKISVTASLLSRLNHPIFTKKNGLNFIEDTIHKNCYVDFMKDAESKGFDKKGLLHLIEMKRLEWGVTNSAYNGSSIAKEYLADLITAEIYPMKSYEEWKEIDLQHSFVGYLSVLCTTDPNLYVASLAGIPIESREFLIKGADYSYAHLDFSKTVFEAITNKVLYVSVLMESIYHFSPVSYGKVLYRFYKDAVLEGAGLTEEEVDQLLKAALEHSLFDKYEKNEIAEKFMNEDEKLIKEIDATIQRIENAYYLSSLNQTLSASNKLLADSRVQDALVNKFSEIKTGLISDSLKERYEIIKNLEQNEFILASTTEKLYEQFNQQMIQQSVYKENDIDYLVYITNVLVNHYKNEDTLKENELCQTAM